MSTHSHNHHHCQAKALKDAERICAGTGARFTAHRRRVFDILWQSHRAMTAADIMQQMDNKHPPITYRALEFLKTHNLIHHVTSLNAYIGCSHSQNDNHLAQMLICTQCRTVTELNADSTLQNLQHAAADINFTPQTIHLEILGTCQNCTRQ